MKVGIVQFDNRSWDALGRLPFLVRRNMDYAARHAYGYHFIREAHFDLPVYWQKLVLVRRALEARYDIVLWLDTDAVVHDLDRRVESLFEGEEAMVGAPDKPEWQTPFNAGVFAVQGAGGVEILKRWEALFAGTRWRRTETAWICDEVWAGPDFEQGAFNLHLLPELTASGRLRLVDWKVLQSPTPAPESFTLHFPTLHRRLLPDYMATL